jgi:hypothetical protein
MLMMAKSVLDLDRIDSLESIFDQIRLISADELREIANEMFDDARLSQLIFLPE